jgi:hypothetical protein
MQSIEEHDEYCDVCKGFHNPLYACVAKTKKITESDWLKLQQELEKLITSVKVGVYGK